MPALSGPERGASSATEVNYLSTFHAFLSERFETRTPALEQLTAQDANRFILRRSQHLSISRAKLLATALRNFLRYLHQNGDTAVNLANTVLPITGWRLQGLPKLLSPEQVRSILDGCDRGTVIGRRDHAILLVLARLGLRAGEVVALTLDDLDWGQGVVTVTGKGQRREPLPLPCEVGEALAAYLQDCRPLCGTRRLFVRIRAPHRGFTTLAAICNVLWRALARAGIELPFRGAHLLRHTLATGMLCNGASLEDIGQILRHRHPETTQNYAKLDLEALRSLAPCWPGDAP